jgi:hypothetical protein
MSGRDYSIDPDFSLRIWRRLPVRLVEGRQPRTIRCERLASSQSVFREPRISFDLPNLQDVPLRVG